ncbi:hypothetical protein [Chroococcidiopsis sp. SAG 2025]|uniref:hypothetical protein n=1 Tax=Chroococcidiopsis sp. SAG 2025 TaxID=171389 RepID=UPI0029370A2C|nr:hypothetical protein [Chroococcidiopsis sp. SAG 2025]
MRRTPPPPPASRLPTPTIFLATTAESEEHDRNARESFEKKFTAESDRQVYR